VGPNVPGIKAYLGQSKPNKLTSNGHSSWRRRSPAAHRRLLALPAHTATPRLVHLLVACPVAALLLASPHPRSEKSSAAAALLLACQSSSASMPKLRPCQQIWKFGWDKYENSDEVAEQQIWNSDEMKPHVRPC
jgi:hypothetical protein